METRDGPRTVSLELDKEYQWPMLSPSSKSARGNPVIEGKGATSEMGWLFPFSLARVEFHDSQQEFNKYPKHAGQRDTESQGSG